MSAFRVYCYICGVSFCISRLRTKDEPREHTFQGVCTSQLENLSYIEDDVDFTRCDVDTGCLKAFRGNLERGRSSYWDPRSKTDCFMQELYDDAGFHDDSEDFVPSVSENNEDSIEFEIHEEFEGHPLAESDIEDTEMESENASDDEYNRMAHELHKARQIVLARCDEDALRKCRMDVDDDTGFEKMLLAYRRAESIMKHPENEIITPLKYPDLIVPPHPPADGEETSGIRYGDARSRSDYHQIMERQRYHVWEHIAGRGCRNADGYNGNHITFEEMKSCCTAQVLLSWNPKSNENWQQESDDHAWEADGDCFLSGIMDGGLLRDNNGISFGSRHGVKADNPYYSSHAEASGMPFHPTCLEVYKRVCLHRARRFDADDLRAWWWDQATAKQFDWNPRHEAVIRGQDENWDYVPDPDWNHIAGDEWLAANPCFIPGLQSIVAQVQLMLPSNTHHGNTKEQANMFERFPAEVRLQVLRHLDTIDIAITCCAIPPLYHVAQSLIRSRILYEKPYLWELWCTKPYSRWTGTTAFENISARRMWKYENDRISEVMNILDEEGADEAKEAYKLSCESTQNERKRKALHVLYDKPALHLNENETDFVKLAIELDRGCREDLLKGLRNRERIWKDCNWILDEIETMGNEGKLPLYSEFSSANRELALGKPPKRNSLSRE